MALSKDQKQAQVAELKDKMSSANSIIFAHYIGLSVAEIADLRSKLKEGGAEMKVAKKTLTKIATKESGLPEIADENIEGPVSLIFSNDDALAGAQIAFKFAKDHDQVELIGGIFEGNVISKEEAVELAKMLSRTELLAKFVGICRSPLVNFAGICSSPLSGFVRAVSELAKQKPASDESPADKPAEEAPAEEKAEEKPAEEAAKKETEESEEAEEKNESSDSPDSPKKNEETPEPEAEDKSAEESTDEPKEESQP